MSSPRTSERKAGAASAALAYVRRNWPVLPLRGKLPLLARGLHDASTDPALIAEWWQRWPEANVGVRTGGGLVVLDVDGDDGADSLHELEREHGELPQTVAALTGGGGRHYYFATAEAVRNSAGRLGRGLDVRGDGGYVVCPPSVHESGRAYEWEVSGHPAETRLAPLPAWLAERLRERSPGQARPVSEWRELAAGGAREGERNARTASLAGHLLARGVDTLVTLELLIAWDATRNRPSLGGDEVTRVVASIARREARKPR